MDAIEERRRLGPGLVLELPGHHERGPPIDVMLTAWRAPEAGIVASHAEYVRWLGIYYDRVAEFLVGADTVMSKFATVVVRRAKKVPHCHSKVRRAACRPCGAPIRYLRPIDTCDAWTCPRCMASRREGFGAAMEAFALDNPPDRHLAYYSFTITAAHGERRWLPDYVGLAETLKEAIGAVADQLWSRVATRRGSGIGARLDRAGVRWAFDLSRIGELHLHGVRYGAFHPNEEATRIARTATPEAHVHSEVLWRGKRGAASNVGRWARYMEKALTSEKKERPHPLLAAVADVALADSNRRGGRGALSSMDPYEVDRRHAHDEKMICPKCGSTDWELEDVDRVRGTRRKVTDVDWVEAEATRMGVRRIFPVK